jgi:hypothetical protein
MFTGGTEVSKMCSVELNQAGKLHMFLFLPKVSISSLQEKIEKKGSTFQKLGKSKQRFGAGGNDSSRSIVQVVKYCRSQS